MMLRKEYEGCPRGCEALCCQYIVTKIKAPRTKADFDELYWFLCHEKIVVCVERRKWYLMIQSNCKHLDDNCRCNIYPQRPYVCREHSIKECEYQAEIDYDLFMRSTDDLKHYMAERGLSLRMAWNDPDLEANQTSLPRPSVPSLGRGKQNQKKKR